MTCLSVLQLSTAEFATSESSRGQVGNQINIHSHPAAEILFSLLPHRRLSVQRVAPAPSLRTRLEHPRQEKNTMLTLRALGPLDLRNYCAQAVLAPPVVSDADKRRINCDTPRVQSSLRCLPTRGDRSLEGIVGIEAACFNDAVQEFQVTLPCQPVNMRRILPKESLTIGGYGSPHRDYSSDLSTKSGVATTVEDSVLMTTRRVMHLAVPEALKYSFRRVGDRDNDSELADKGWERFAWAIHSELPNRARRADDLKLLCVVQPPWVLTPKEFTKFTKAQPWSDEPRPVHPEESMTPLEKLWGRTHDFLKENRAHFFVVTNYIQWSFGVFSSDYSRAHITQPIVYDSQQPTILQMMVYWVQSSMNHPSGWQVPTNNITSRRRTIDPIVLAMDFPGYTLQRTVPYLELQQSDAGHPSASTILDTQSYQAPSARDIRFGTGIIIGGTTEPPARSPTPSDVSTHVDIAHDSHERIFLEQEAREHHRRPVALEQTLQQLAEVVAEITSGDTDEDVVMGDIEEEAHAFDEKTQFDVEMVAATLETSEGHKSKISVLEDANGEFVSNSSSHISTWLHHFVPNESSALLVDVNPHGRRTRRINRRRPAQEPVPAPKPAVALRRSKRACVLARRPEENQVHEGSLRTRRVTRNERTRRAAAARPRDSRGRFVKVQ